MTSPANLEPRLYEDLRTRLVDRTRRNRLLHFAHGAKAGLIRVVDKAPDDVFTHLRNEGRVGFRPLPDPERESPDEKTPEFQAALRAAHVTDEAYRRAVAELDADDPAASARETRIERELADRVRAQRRLPPPQKRRAVELDAYARAQGVDPSFDLAQPSRTAGAGHRDRLQTLLFPDQLRTRQSGIARKAKEVEQETGVSTLHFAFGFLEWFESDASEAAFCSPLLLLPAGFERKAVRGGEEEFWLAALEEAPITNLSLELRLHEDFGLALPPFEPDVEQPIETYFAAVMHMIRRQPRWRIRRFLTLAPFSFARIAMFRDLDPANWPFSGAGPTSHALVRPLLRSGADNTEPGWGGNTFANDYEVDRPELAQLAPVLVHDADSSQHSAIIDAMQGRSFVVEGPPGTGKSQTIANLIANALHRGSTVLFVSEKMAALDVVKSRLDRVGLGPFCLALHSAGAKTSIVIEALKARERLTVSREATFAESGGRAERARSGIAGHLAAMHSVIGPIGETVHALVGRMAELGRVLPELPGLLRSWAPEMPDPIDVHASAEARSRLEALEMASVVASRPGWNPATSPFRVLERADLFQDEQAVLLEGLGALADGCERLRTKASELVTWLGGGSRDLSLASIRKLALGIGALPDPGLQVDRAMLGRLTSPQGIEDARWATRLASEAEGAVERLQAAGVKAPSALSAGPLAVALRLSNALADGCRIRDVAPLAAGASAEADDAEAQARTLGALSDILGFDPDPEIGIVRLACVAAQLAAQADPWVHAHRRPGLERHAEVLHDAAARQDAIEQRLKAARQRLDIEGVSPADLRMKASLLRTAGLLSLFRSDVRGARRFYRTRWKAGPLPRRIAWADNLDEVADALAQQKSLREDEQLCAAVGAASDPLLLPLRHLALAARWQKDVHITLATASVEAAELRAALFTTDRLHRLATLAEPARALLSFVDRCAPPLGQRWSALRDTFASRAACLADLAKALAETGLDGDVLVADLGGIADAREQWDTSEAALSSARARALLAGAPPVVAVLRATTDFAAAVFANLPSAAAFLLADGWTDRVAGLKASAARTSEAASEMQRTLGLMEPLGLASFARTASDQPLDAVRLEAAELLSSADELPGYLRFATERRACLSDRLAGPVLKAIESASRPLRNMPEALDWLVAWTLVRRRAETDRATFSRTGDELSVWRQRFAEADRGRRASDARTVASVVSQRRVPPGSSLGSKREWTDGALLLNEFTKQRRHIPVRELMGRASDAVLALTPCLMMSPLTVAQYLKPGRVAFDLVVMDEASQIKPEDALGAMLRGRQAIIVGDPKQLPPTNFFDRALEEAEEEEPDDEDSAQLSAEDRIAAESVLDLAMRAFQPARRLRWHYRSQHQSLIAYSNRAFYGDDLVVFPAATAASETLGVELVRVDGRWRDRVNAEEAKAVALAVAEFTHRHSDLSLGLVAMNQSQRELIEAEIDLLTTGYPGIAQYRDAWEKRLEPFFVKNLENVQGDERDVIFVSLGWGRTPEGAMHQRFFPVNRREDGHRRLNVLFTRAKRKIVVFASLDPEDIVVDPEKTSRGVRVLREYLSYARDGRLEPGVESDGKADSPFEASVANALRARGHDVALQVGVAGYRIDIAARHPEQPDRFLLGIECDGAAYHSAKSARDRDRLRQEALERLGWRLTRVWSTDWFRDPAGQIDRLSAEIERAVADAGQSGSARHRLVPQNLDVQARRESGVTLARGRRRPSTRDTVAREAQQDLLGPSATLDPAAPAHPPEPVPPPDLVTALRSFRDDVIMRDLPGSEPSRCILRDEMIAKIAEAALDDADDFSTKIPQWLRTRTDGRQVRYLERICDIVATSTVAQRAAVRA